MARSARSGTASRRLHLHFYAKPLEVVGDDDGRRRGVPLRAHRARTARAASRGTGEIREVPVQAVYRAVGYFGSPLRRHPVRRAARRHPEPRGPGARRRRPARARRLRDRLDQARPGRPHRPHQVATRWRPIKHLINDQANWWTPGAPDPRRRSSSCSTSAASSTPTSTAGTASTSTRSRSASRTAARASRSCRATRWCRSPAS